MHQKITPRTLLVVTSLFAFAGLVSYIGAKFVLPSLFPYWGIALIVVLGGWAATSTWLLLINDRGTISWLVVIILVAAGVAGGMIPWIGLVALLLILLAGLVLFGTTLLLLLLRLWRRHTSIRLVLLGFVPMLASVIMLAIANLIRPGPPALPTHTHSVSDELRYIYETDQRDRLTSYILFNSTRDQTRLQRVLTLDQKGLITAPEAQYHAALILQHGTCPDHFGHAYELSHAAAQAQVADAQWLSRASYDRWMLSIGKPQKYNTQWFVWQQVTCDT
ncbi:hypothetical protein NIES4073_69280 [Kalymmatonema gypsitolerans NIES-4073]|nr:hypothetical protein NIES4073_69280 [Scytonema sp. NIES-4073]